MMFIEVQTCGFHQQNPMLLAVLDRCYGLLFCNVSVSK